MPIGRLNELIRTTLSQQNMGSRNEQVSIRYYGLHD